MSREPDLFACCALAAFVEVAGASGTWPDSAAVRRLAYRYYEAELAAKNGGRPDAEG